MGDELMEWRLLMELPDGDAEALKSTALECGTTVAGLVEGFILDLTRSPGSNGEEAENLAGAWMDYKHGVVNGETTFEEWLANSGRLEEAVRSCMNLEEMNRRISKVREEMEGEYELVMGEKVAWYLCDDYGYSYDTLEEWKDVRQREVRDLQNGVARERELFQRLWNSYEGHERLPHMDDTKALTTEPAHLGPGGDLDTLLSEKAADLARWGRNAERGMAPKSSARHVPVRNWKRDGRYCMERELTVETSYAAVGRLREAAFGRGVTVARLLESFVHDLAGGDVVLDDWKQCAMPNGFSRYLAKEGQLERALRSYGKVASCQERISSLEDAIAYGTAGHVPWTECEDWNGNRYESREAWNHDLQRDIETLRGQLADSWKFLTRQWNGYRMSSRVPSKGVSMMEELARMSEAGSKVARELEPVEAMMVRKSGRTIGKRPEKVPSL